MTVWLWDSIPAVRKRRLEDNSRDKCFYIRLIYILAIILWIFLIFVLSLYRTGWLGYLILSLPIIAFLIGFYNISSITEEVEVELFSSNYWSIGLMIVIPLLVWLDREYKGDKKWFSYIFVTAVIFSTLSLLDVWLPRDWLSINRHVSSILQTMSIVLLVFALYVFFAAQ